MTAGAAGDADTSSPEALESPAARKTRRRRFSALGLLLLAACGTAPLGCRREAPPPVGRAPAGDSVAGAVSGSDTAAGDSAAGAVSEGDTAAGASPAVAYRRLPVESASALRALQRELGEERFHLVLKVNRLDLAHVRDRDSLAVPDPLLDEQAYSPFPAEIPAASSLPKLLLVSLRVQAFAAFENGRQVRWGPTSSGRRDKPTPPGLYHANWKARERRSTIDEEWLLKWCVNIENSGISLHQYDLPGYPASHSCVRLLAEDARWVHDWVEQWKVSADERTVLEHGTPVVIFGEYAFGERPPWKRLPEDPQATALGSGEIGTALRGVLPVFASDTTSVPEVSGAPAVSPAGKR